MSFSALKDGEVNYVFNMTDEEWASLKSDKTINLALPCCGKKAVCKESKQGVRYFDHDGAGERCKSHVDISLDGLSIKLAFVNVLKERGWTVETEKAISKHTADIYAENSKHKMCVQLQMSSPSIKQLERKDKDLKDQGIKPLWLVKFSDSKLKRNISEYNNKANVFSIAKTHGKIMIGGFFAIERRNGVDYLGDVQQIELSDFINSFFIQKRIQRHQLDKNILINFEYVGIKCSNCYNATSVVLHTNAAFRIGDTPVQFARVWYEDIEDKIVLNYINQHSKEAHLGVGITYVLEYGYDDEEDVVVQYCAYCESLCKLKKEARNITKTKQSPYRDNTRLNYTELGVRFKAIWIIKHD